MIERETPPVVELTALTRDFAEKHAGRIAEIANEIPGVNWTPEGVLREEAAGRPLPGKWHHSLVYVDKGRPFCVALAAERSGEGEGPFSEDSLHLSVLACASEYQGNGYGKRLLREFLAKALLGGYIHNKGDIALSLTTDASEDNQYVRRLYESHGFSVVGYKSPAKTHVVMRALPADIELSLVQGS